MKFSMRFIWFWCLACVILAEDEVHHRSKRKGRDVKEEKEKAVDDVNSKLLDQEYWTVVAQGILKKQLTKKLNTNIAKNVIFFLGDGMSLPTVTAARIYKGQLAGKQGEEEQLSFEEFPYVGLAKTYCVDKQVGDSACTATAYLGGVKANEGTIGVSAHVEKLDCTAMRNVSNHVYSIADWAQKAGKSTGFATTTRVTHASPAGLYAHVAERDWEEDFSVSQDGFNATYCPDIAQQLIYDAPGTNFNVILGGGRRNFYPQELTDAQGMKGKRRDGRNLIATWENDKIKRQSSYAYVTTRDQLLGLKTVPDYLLGLFSPGHMDFHLDATALEPTLEEMTTAAIKVLQKNPNGFFLFVEGGKIDTAHHENLAHKSLDETVEFSKAVSAAVRMTDEEDTLIIVSADHAHVMSMSGYPKKGNDIFGFAGEGTDGLPYTTLSYANGPGYRKSDITGKRMDLRKVQTDMKSFKFPTLVPTPIETHGGDDVGVFARGPWAHLFSGSYEQNFIPHALGYASCLGKGITVCHDKKWSEIRSWTV